MPRTEMVEDFSAPRAATVHHLPTSEEAPVDGQPTSAPAAEQQYVLIDPVGMLGRPNSLGSRQQIEAELDVIALAVRAFHRKQPDQVMRETAAYSARLTELAVLLHRVEASDRQYTRIRTQQVERYLVELDRQYKIASRLVEVMRQDMELMR